MENNQTVRKPKQARSINTKEKILETALKLFCEKGYLKTTTNEIAKIAGVSIGSLYSYFNDKDTIFLEILNRYNDIFLEANTKAQNNISVYRADKKAWLRELIENLIEIHKISIELNKEINILYYSMPEVAAIMDKQREKTRQLSLDFFFQWKDDIKVKDIEAAALVSYDIISSIVERIVFKENKISEERIIETGIDALYKFLME